MGEFLFWGIMVVCGFLGDNGNLWESRDFIESFWGYGW